MQRSVDQYKKKHEELQQEVRETTTEVLTQRMEIRELAQQQLLNGQRQKLNVYLPRSDEEK